MMRDYALSHVGLLALCASSFLFVCVTLFSNGLNIVHAQSESRLNVVIDAANCFLTIEGEANQPHYSAIDAVDILSSETLQSNCVVENFSTTTVNVAPFYETRLLRADGDIVTTSGGETAPIILAPQEKKMVVTSLPKPTSPQYYVAKLRYGEESNDVSYRYVLQGSNVTVKNSSVNIIKQGESEIANVSFEWVPPVTFSENSRIGKKPTLLHPLFTVSVTDESGALCAEPLSQVFSDPRVNARLSIPLTSLCVNPRVTIVPANSLEENSNQKVENSEKNVPVLSETAPVKFWTIYTICIAIFTLLLIAVGIFAILKKRGTLFILLTMLIMGGSTIVASKAEAQWSCGCVVSYGSGPCHYEPAQSCGGNGWVNGGSVPFNFTYSDYETYCDSSISVTASCADPDAALCGSTNNSCSPGTLSDVADDATYYLWNCLGSSSNASCSLTKPVNGVCGATSNSCTAGTFSDSADGYGTSVWSCLGAGTGTTANCSIQLPPPSVVANVTNCTVAAYSNNCVSSVSWTFSNPLQQAVYKNNGTGLISTAVSDPAYPLTVWLGGYNNTVIFKDDTNSTDYDYSTWQIGSVVPSPSCAASTTWNGSVCTPTLSGSCGIAARLYSVSESAYQGSYCGSPFYGISSVPAFPAQGATSTWSCLDSDGVARNQCSASRAVAGVCGTADDSVYAASDTAYTGTFCSFGAGPSPTSPAFPSMGSNTSWNCQNSDNTSGATCTASRNPDVPGVPVGLIATPLACDTEQIFLDWDDVSTATSYSVYSSTGTWIDNSLGSNYTHNGSLNTAYSYVVRANNVTGSSGDSNVVSATTQGACPENIPPIAGAGPDEYITLPINSVSVSGASASDSDSSVASTVWSKVSGPAGESITNGNTLTPTFGDMNIDGVYVYRLTVTDNQGGSQTDDMSVFVNPIPQCADGIDNDGDGFIDILDTEGCVDGNDTDETDVFPPPTITINSNANNTVFINPNESVTVSWDTNNGNETLCTLTTSTNPDNIGNVVIDPLPGAVGSELGTLDSEPITVKTRFTVTCGAVSDSIVVELIPSAFES